MRKPSIYKIYRSGETAIGAVRFRPEFFERDNYLVYFLFFSSNNN